MSEPSPADGAVTFRSFPRRVREALGTDDPPAGPGRRLLDLLAATHQHLAAMALAPDRPSLPDLIDAIPARAWQQHPDALALVQSAVAEGSAIVRELERSAEADRAAAEAERREQGR